MRAAHASEFRHYWMRYLIAFWAGESLRWARDNILLACVGSIVPGLVAAGLGAALSDNKWRVATYATLLTYTGLFVLFLAWRLAFTAFELDQERNQVIIGLSNSLIYTKSKLAAWQARPPAVDAEILEIHVQGENPAAFSIPNFSVDRNIFLRVKLRLRETRPTEVLNYELSAVLHGNSLHTEFLDDIEDWGLVTERKPIGIGTTFCYILTKLDPLVRKLDRAGVPVEGWLHFHVKGVREREIAATIFRLNVVTPTGAVSTDIRGDKSIAELESREFQRLPYAAYEKKLLSG